MLVEEERDRILQALNRWVELTPQNAMFGFIGSGDFMTPREVLEAVLRQSSDGEAIMEMIEHVIRRTSLDNVIQRLEGDTRTTN